MTQTFSTKKELAEKLMAGEKWRLKSYIAYCYYDKSELNPFRVDNAPMSSIWEYCDGKTEWELVEDRPKTKTVWFWKVINKHLALMPSVMSTEEEIRAIYNTYPDTVFKRLDILGSEEVMVGVNNNNNNLTER